MNEDLLSTEEAKKTSLKELEQRLSSSESGISSEEAAKRLVQYGYNEISEKKTSPIVKFLTYFWGPIPWMIEIAAILSAIIQHWEDFIIIFALLFVNAGVGFWQEHKAAECHRIIKTEACT